ncbi:MAG TPA: PLP-dependent aminotransferase family protein [Treponemataceae bacterium]|nr:PLP-dependent aminotransferase family protein [Treponemataceae bacterium]
MHYADDMYGITFDPAAKTSQYRQLVNQLRDRIAKGTIPGGTKLASSRELADRLGIARGIILEAIEQLKLEGYLKTVRGSGTYVVGGLVWARGKAEAGQHGSPREGDSSRQGSSPRQIGSTRQIEAPESPDPTAGTGETGPDLSFAPGMPDLSLFPRRAWLSCYHDALEYTTDRELGYCPPVGSLRLREAIAAHVCEVKGITADPEYIVIAAGASQCFSILASLFDPCKVIMEDPQAPFVRRVFTGLDARMTWVPVDEEGIIPEKIPGNGAHYLYVTTNHQFPLGGTLSAARRVQLLTKARETGSWIIEDDFDSEFRYGGKPVAPLQVMDPEQVIYVGTFSKILSPSLRLGFMIVPPGLRIRIKMAKLRWDFWNESLQQKALALFIERGHLARHLTRSHRAYRTKNIHLASRLESSMPGIWQILGNATGMHLVIKPVNGSDVNTRMIAQELRKNGIQVPTIGEYCRENRAFEDALILGYGNHTTGELDHFVDCLAALTQPEKLQR